MRTRVVTVALVALLAVSACGTSSKPESEAERDKDKNGLTAATAATTAAAQPDKPAPNCVPVPAAGAPVTWLPADLPMPPGSYAVQELTISPPSKGAVFVVPKTMREYVSFVVAEFPKAGFHLGRGDSEADEAEDSFSRGNSAGAFRARRPYCDTTKTEVQLTYVADLQAAKTTTTTTMTK